MILGTVHHKTTNRSSEYQAIISFSTPWYSSNYYYQLKAPLILQMWLAGVIRSVNISQHPSSRRHNGSSFQLVISPSFRQFSRIIKIVIIFKLLFQCNSFEFYSWKSKLDTRIQPSFSTYRSCLPHRTRWPDENQIVRIQNQLVRSLPIHFPPTIPSKEAKCMQILAKTEPTIFKDDHFTFTRLI